jgi:hypothetical protein
MPSFDIGEVVTPTAAAGGATPNGALPDDLTGGHTGTLLCAAQPACSRRSRETLTHVHLALGVSFTFPAGNDSC